MLCLQQLCSLSNGFLEEASCLSAQAMDAGREIFLTALLPDRKLRWLAQQPLAVLPAGRDGERCLMLWTFEDGLKQR